MDLADAGFAVNAECLCGAECDELLDAIAGSALQRSRAGMRHLMSVPAVAGMARSQKLMALARPWLGESAIPFRATLFEKSQATNWLIPWHQDTALPLVRRFEQTGWGPWSEKAGAQYAHAPAWALERVVALRVHLDESGEDNGPLRVIPGSHRQGVLSDCDIASLAAGRTPMDCLSPRGGVVAMRPLVIHASRKASSVAPRRVLHIEYIDALDLGGDIRIAVV